MVKSHQSRLDLSRWVTHFVHSNHEEYSPIINGIDLTYIPDYQQHMDFAKRQENYFEKCEQGFADDDNNLDCIYSPFSIWQDFEETEEPFPKNSPPFEVLKRIIKTGYIRASWSFRTNKAAIAKPTIYGERAACCFTEMPLYALLEYVRYRSDSNSVAPYGIALDRDELFEFGGRPVIYGLSVKHKEQPNHFGWPRMLADSCGISKLEQFRYVATKPKGKIDWTHKREWRWPFDRDRCNCPGLPILLENAPFKFSKILIFVPTKKEGDEILDLLKVMYDSETVNLGEWEYDKIQIQNTRVFSLEEAQAAVADKVFENIRFEDIPLHSVRQFIRPNPSNETIELVRRSIQDARLAGEKAGNSYRKVFLPNTDHCFWDLFGWAFIRCISSQSEFMAAIEQIAAEEGLHITPLNDAGCQIEGLVSPEATSRGTLKEGIWVSHSCNSSSKSAFPGRRICHRREA